MIYMRAKNRKAGISFPPPVFCCRRVLSLEVVCFFFLFLSARDQARSFLLLRLTRKPAVSAARISTVPSRVKLSVPGPPVFGKMIPGLFTALKEYERWSSLRNL